MKLTIALADQKILSRIYLIRGRKIMLDRELAELYGVNTKALKQAVRRNLRRFPQDFMFEMSMQEFKNWRSQFVTSNLDKMGLRHMPFCFTEQGVAMLSSILNSEKAIAVNIRIMRVFTRIRQAVLTQKNIRLKLDELEKKVLEHDRRHRKKEEDIQLIFNALKQLLGPSQNARKRIGYRLGGEE